MAGLASFVAENTNNPGTDMAVPLLGAIGGYNTFSTRFANGATPFYYIADGAQWECGVGTLTTTPTPSLARTTVLENSAGTTARLNFSGPAIIYNYLPASRTIYIDDTGVTLLGKAYATSGLSCATYLTVDSGPVSFNSESFTIHGSGHCEFGWQMGTMSFDGSSNYSILPQVFPNFSQPLARLWNSDDSGGNPQINYIVQSDNIGYIRSPTSNQLIVSTTSGSYIFVGTASDRRLKRNISAPEISDPLGHVNRIDLTSFDWQNGGAHVPLGMIAQQVQSVAPHLVQSAGDDTPLAIDTGAMLALLIGAVQQLSAEIARLKGE